MGSQIGNQASFDPRNYGYGKLSDLVEAIGLFDTKRDQLTTWIREKGKAKAAVKATKAKDAKAAK